MTTPLPLPSRTARVRRYVGKSLLRTGARIKRLIVAVTKDPTEPRPAIDPPLDETGHHPVVAYFAETPVRYYQLRQWLPVLEKVATERPVLIVTRSWATTKRLREQTHLPVTYTKTLDGLLTTYTAVDAKVVVYVNNGMRNFQSLIYRRALHVHLNHGESDKVSMVSNQAKSYDHVVVAGQAAIERHRRTLINFDLDTLVVCGRPQLDLDVESTISPVPGKRTVFYAPTWSGEDDANNYTSLDHYGVAIAQGLLAIPDVRVVYKPHPRVLTSTEPAVAAAHEEIVRLITEANDGRDEPHLLPFEEDILGLFDTVDLLVTDISSVGLDFLYLRPDVPIVLTDRRTDRARLLRDAPIAGATDVVDAESVHDVAGILSRNLEDDPRHEVRTSLRDHYFGFARGESSVRFRMFLEECIDRRDAEVGSVVGAQPGATDAGDSEAGDEI
ncbi:CDP-glycerol glycerophosphotransferase family protein [Isoptericola jiangsuensis]|uniref:CDP-glycerol glycerophosphotransferase family protein n=1 Tax=Isoptericola jiangsuensis TaxID=548579 RepID=UPI003AAE2BFC